MLHRAMVSSGRKETIDLATTLGEPRDPPPPVTEVVPDLALWFTIDTEASVARQRDPDPERTVDNLIFGDWGGGEQHGIGLHMDLLEHCGYRGCFFVDVLLEYQFGQAALERVIEAIEARGHEVQLHVHPEHLARSDDQSIRSLAGNLLRKTTDEFRSVMELAVNLFERRTGRPPIAYRAGGYRITDDHFQVLEEFDIAIDASVNIQWHSQVADWMKTRTQPYWVGNVLELPLTWILIRDNRASQGTRSFAPNLTTGDPISGMPASAHGVPRVATFVSHSFELMQADRDASPAALAEFRERLRAKLGPDEGDKLADAVGSNMRIYDGTVATDVVAVVAEMLGRIADRPGARCVTCADLLDMADAFPRDQRPEPVDPIPAIDRRHKVKSVIGSRIYSMGLRDRLSRPGEALASGKSVAPDQPIELPQVAGQAVALIESAISPSTAERIESAGASRLEKMAAPAPNRSSEFDLVVWPDGFERCAPSELGSRIDAAAAMLRPGGMLALRARTLGHDPARSDGPPIAELVFPAGTVASASDGEVAPMDGVTSWDGSTFAAWFSARGYELVGQRRLARGRDEVALIERFSDKLGALAAHELQTAAVDFILRPSDRTDGADDLGDATDATPPEGIAGLIGRFTEIRPGDEVLVLSSRRGRSKVEKPQDGTLRGRTSASLLKRPPKAGSYDLIVATEVARQVGPERLQEACFSLYRALRPGGELLIRLDLEPPATPSATTALACLLRAGFEVMDSAPAATSLDCRLIRPLDPDDIQKFFRNG
jgi:hypothetical protein